VSEAELNALVAAAKLVLNAVKMLTGILDPPPEGLSVPWGYLLALGLAAAASMIMAVIVVRAYSRRQIIETLRGL